MATTIDQELIEALELIKKGVAERKEITFADIQTHPKKGKQRSFKSEGAWKKYRD